MVKRAHRFPRLRKSPNIGGVRCGLHRKASQGGDRRARRLSTIPAVLALAAVFLPQACRADRILLAPSADMLPPRAFRTELDLSALNSSSSMSWMQFTTASGVELEGERVGLPTGPSARYGLNLEYPILPDLGAFPSVAVGIRDLLGTGVDHKALFVAATRSFPLSDRQLRLFRRVSLTAGLGTGRLDGPFVGGKASLTTGIGLYAEIYRRRPDFGVSLPIGHHVEARAYTLDGTPYLGLAYSLVR